MGKHINKVCLVIQARLNSERVPKKMIKPFAGSTLLDVCISKVIKSSIIPKKQIYLSCNEKEISSIGLKYGINIFERSKESANEESDMRTIFEWHKSLGSKYKYVILVSACNPFLAIESIDAFIKSFLLSKEKGSLSVIKKNNYTWDKNGLPITDWKGLKIMNTKLVDHFYESANCLYASEIKLISKNMFMDDSSPPNPSLFEVDEFESFDIDYPWQFELAESIFKLKKRPTLKNPRELQFIFEKPHVVLLGPTCNSEIDIKSLSEKKEKGAVIVSFSSSSLLFLNKIGFVPDFHTFIDPQSYCSVFEKVKLNNSSFPLEKINYLGYNILTFENLFSTNLKVWNKKNAGISNFLSNEKYVEIYETSPPAISYNACFTKDPSIIDYGESLKYCESSKKFITVPKLFDKNIDFRSTLYRVKNGRKEIDKLTYYVLPMLMYWFKNLSELEIYGFGFFEKERYLEGNNASYNAYKSAYNKILPFYKKNKFEPEINLSISKDSYFYELKNALKNK